MAGQVVRKIDVATGKRLQQDLQAAGYEFRDVQHARFAAKGPGVSVTLYESGKLLVQGKGADDFAATFLAGGDDDDGAPPAAPEDTVDAPIIGADESGKGDYFGPLVAAAILVTPDDAEVLRTLGVRDSKSVGDREAGALGRQLEDAYGDKVEVVSIGPAKYNELYPKFGSNLNRLLAWAHGQAMQSVLDRHECGHVLVDRFANEAVMHKEFAKRGIEAQLSQRVRAESHPAVAAASIIARARFLRELGRLGRDTGAKLPKGAGSPVDDVARQLYREGGVEGLRSVAKLHFKNTDKARR